ncbi:MAG: restriction endonuclease subunit S [Pseudomonadota bacterium]
MHDASAEYDLQMGQTTVPIGYKQTEVGVIPEDWDVKPLHNLSIISRLAGAEYTSLWKESPDGEIIALRGFNIGQGKIIERDVVRISNKLSLKLKRSRLCKGDVVYPCVGSIGNAVVINDDNKYHIQQNIARITPDPEYISPHFLANFLMSSLANREVERFSSSSSQPSVLVGSLRQYRVPLPPRISEQRAIATALSDVDALIEGLDQLIAKKRDLKQAAMQKLLNGETRLPGFEGEWRVKQLDDLAHIVMGQSPNSSNYNLSGDGLPLIQGNADIDGRKTIKRVFTTQITKHGRAGDILMSVRAPVGEISRATFEVCLGRGVCALRSTNEFLYHYLIYLEPSWAKHSKGSTFDSVNSADIKTVEVWLPSDPDEQFAIASILSDMDAELEALEQRRIKTAELKQAMMQELLTGRTRLV